MREILFRGKYVCDGDWIYGYYVGPAGSDTSHEICDISDGVGARLDVDPETVGQYTGLKDKNGQRIFEGDICRNTRTNEIVSVKWHGTMAGYVWSKRKENSHLFDFGELFRAYDKYEVIGNIHDNPELLKEDAT